MTLQFYEDEYKQFKSFWETTISPYDCNRLFKRVKRHYKLKCVLVFRDMKEGEYCPEKRVICLCLKPSIGLIVHELAHAVEDQYFGKTEHKKRMMEIIKEIYTIVNR